MSHLTEEELILHFYGETDRKDEARVEAHLASCGQCRAQQAAIKRVLHLDQHQAGWFSWLRAPQWALAGGVAALVVATFVAGRFVGSPATPDQPAASTTVASEISPARVLNAAVGDHLDRSQMMLVELVNSADHPGELADEQARAGDLVAANRLYRQSAEQLTRANGWSSTLVFHTSAPV
jgi:hypothetical protein